MSEPRITTLFLDIGGVLLTNGWDRRMRRSAAETFGLDFDEMNERHHLTFDTYEEGELTLDDYLTRVIFYENRPFTREDFKAFMYARSEPKSDMIHLMTKLKKRHGLKMATISNEGRELTLYRVKKFNLGSFIDFFIASCFVHFRKPDLRLYRLALDCAQVLPEEGFYIDDRKMFVEVAEGIGLRGIHHTEYDRTRTSLAALGLSAD
ncbi:MAG: HAD family phosphatase [Deltaproteobacteria bacterium]|jgi:putative hydrolase of the HAD superfamily